MNYYIKGNAAKAEQIRAAFEVNGIDTSANSNYGISNLFYFSCNGEVAVTQNRSIINIIKTHPDYQELELPVEPKFKVGDSLQSGSMWAMVRRIDTENQRYICQFDNVIPFEEQDRWNFVPNPKKHYAIANFHAGMPVLVREYDTCVWQWVQYSHFNGVGLFFAAGKTWRQCIPFNDDTKHLLGTTDMPSEEYINW